jgi:TPR repeat protein
MSDELKRAMELRNQILRGDMMIGILPLGAADEMIALFRRAAEGGLSQAWLELGRCQASGVGVDGIAADPEGAIESFRNAADAGLREGAVAFVRHAYFVLRDPDVAEEAGRRALALLTDDPDGSAHLLCGYLAFQGYGRPKDAVESLRLHREAAARGNADAMFEIYVLLSTGQGAEKDEATALEWCQKAASQGHARACYNLGAFYATGRGVEKDAAQSVAWYERASEAGHGRASAMVGYMLLVGDGMPEDRARAAAFFETADEQGFAVDDFLEQLGVERPASS